MLIERDLSKLTNYSANNGKFVISGVLVVSTDHRVSLIKLIKTIRYEVLEVGTLVA